MKHVSPAALAAMGATALTPKFVGRRRTLDMLTFHNVHTFDSDGNARGIQFERPYKTHDGRTVDSTGAFLVGELERLDQTMHEPLADISYMRDIDLREDVTIADEVSSFTRSTFGSAGGLGTGQGIRNGKAWIGKATNQVSSVSLDIAKIPHPLRPWAMELKYTILELESAARTGRPIDSQMYAGLQLKNQMDVDEQVYVGDIDGSTGLVNSDDVTNVSNVPNGAMGTTQWSTKTPVEILNDVNEILTSAWAAAAWAVMPTELRIPPENFGYITIPLSVTAQGQVNGATSILNYLLTNNIVTASGRGKLNIQPLKWCIGAGVGGTIGTDDGDHNRMVAYIKAMNRVRYPMTLLQRTPVQYDGLYQKTTFYCRLGVLEVVYPETIAYRDGV